MKTLGAFLLLLMLGASAVAQSAPATEASATQTHGLSVVKANWSRHHYNPALEEGSLHSASETIQTEPAQLEAPRPSLMRRGGTRNRRPAPAQTADLWGDDLPRESRDYYVYEVKVLNNGTKKIKLLTWDYVLFDPSTQREVGRHSFETKAGIDLGKGKTLVGMSTLPPVSVVDARKTEKETRPRLTERVDIRRVVYADGAVWERPREK